MQHSHSNEFYRLVALGLTYEDRTPTPLFQLLIESLNLQLHQQDELCALIV